MNNPTLRFVVMVVWALVCVAIAAFGVAVLLDGNTLPGVLCLVVAVLTSIFPVHDAMQFLKLKS